MERLFEKLGIYTVFLLLAYLFVCSRTGKLTQEKKMTCIILYGIIMRAGYMLYTGDDLQNYEIGGTSGDGCGFAVKIVSCFASCVTLLVTESLCQWLKLEEKGRILAVSLTAFLPAMYLAGGSGNGDACRTLLLLLAFFYTCKWYEKPSWKNMIVLALVYGCGIMNQISMGVMAIFTAAVFLIMLWKVEKQKLLAVQLKKYAVFLLINLLSGLCYMVQNGMSFGKKPVYVPEHHCGTYSLVQRFISLDIKNLCSTPYADPSSDYNLPVYQIKTALFGTFTYKINDWIPVLLLFSAVILVIFVWAAVCKIIRNRKTEGFLFWTALAFLLCYANAIWFAYRHPYSCCMDFKYNAVLGVFAAILLGRYQSMEQRGGNSVLKVSAVFCICSCVMYLFIR